MVRVVTDGGTETERGRDGRIDIGMAKMISGKAAIAIKRKPL
jgi:hypothetical protein